MTSRPLLLIGVNCRASLRGGRRGWFRWNGLHTALLEREATTLPERIGLHSMQLPESAVRFVVAGACSLLITTCRSDVHGFRAKLRCGMTRSEIATMAADSGLRRCVVPTEK